MGNRETVSASVIIVNWNGRDFLETCLQSLETQQFRSFEVLLVDNGSEDGSVAMVRERFPWVVSIIENEKNLGFGIANNQAIVRARGRYIVLLNNDTEADERWLGALVAAAEAAPSAGMCASKILNFDRRDVIDNTGHLIYRDGLNRGRGRLEVDVGQYDDASECLFPSGCAALYRKSMLDEIGLFDETFFAYGDDTDLGLRGRLAGWQCVFVPAARVYHRYSATTGQYSPAKAFLVERNRVWVAVKILPLSMLVVSPVHTLARFALQAYGALTGRGAAGRFTSQYSAGSLIRVLLKAYWAALIGLEHPLRERRRILGRKKVPGAEIRRWFREHGISVREIALKD
ncbi:MAG: glycosyltransferase family 2 protein [Candidatus Eisenbacteria sp.]|nr:glycosyltransferase family 2 protein [Candidatus Eisenbacteria bacterium]